MTNPPTTGAGAGNTTTPRVYSTNQAVGKSPIHHFTTYRQQGVTHHNYPNLAPRGPPTQQQGMMYPLGSSGGRGFMPRGVPYGNPARVPYGMHIIRPTHMQQQQPQQQQQHGNSNNHNRPVGAGGVVRGIPVVSHPKVAASPSSNSDRNGYKDTRDINRDDSLATVRDRKVRITDGASLYAQCRSWLRNGLPEESQPQYLDGVKSLPRPLPIPVGDDQSPKEDGDKEEEEDIDVEQLSSKELLQTHIKRAKRVRARLREERLQRIARYKTRLALLLPPIVEQQLRNDTATGN
ncbi:proline-rich receptor-like protein kinase PERK8 [Heracleum sosnowskyi]|uniref:Proline-rich receptor-like protein kinase PERK8 n=1 Tax=Heracleum sosnowskyi TaxID=360622 RepID=A0AAD8HEN9_9APIA|nr:proline-rich receptor-like protein kinase PERK8 [Heracleum sosnowskyi]